MNRSNATTLLTMWMLLGGLQLANVDPHAHAAEPTAATGAATATIEKLGGVVRETAAESRYP